MSCLESVKEVCLHQCVLLLQRLAQLSIPAQQGVELHQVSLQQLHVPLYLCLLSVLCFNLTWWGHSWC